MIAIRNIKISVRTSEVSLNNVLKHLSSENIPHRCYPNFVTFKKDFSFVVFKKSKNNSNHVNISSLRTNQDIKKSLHILKNLLKVKILSLKVDNVVATTNIKKRLNLLDIARSKTLNTKYNPEQFPGVFVKLVKGTAILFHSGKVVIVGSKSYKDLKWVVKEITAGLKT